MNSVTASPNQYNFGLEFNYALWTQGTDITLVNVPWNNDYRDIVRFTNPSINTYIDSIESSGVSISNLSYVKPNQPIRLDIPFNAAYRYNYLRASNPVQPIPGSATKDFYYFITDVRYIAPNTTEVVVQLDVWQTFGYDVTFGQCYVERGHIGIANQNNFTNYGRDYLTIPEGLDMGNEYQIIAKRREILMSNELVHNAKPNVLVASTINLEADAGDMSSPVFKTAEGSNFTGIASGASFSVFDSSGALLNFMARFSSKPWVTQGIISITTIPAISRYDSSFVIGNNGYDSTNDATNPSRATPAPVAAQQSKRYDMFSNWRSSSEILNYIPSRYRHLKKFLTSPYLFIELTTWTGAPALIKPEVWATDSATIVERASLVPPSQRVSFHPFKYNAIAGSATDNKNYRGVSNMVTSVGGDDNGDYLDIGVSISNFPTAAIVNNGAINYMASNNASIGYQRNNADWVQQRAMRTNEVTYDQSSGAIDTSRKLNSIGINADMAQTSIGNNAAVAQGAIGAVSNLAGSAAGGGKAIAGAAIGGASTAASLAVMYTANNASLGVRNNAANSSNRETTGQSSYVRDTNKSLADWSANGDYENTIAGINAKVQDAQLIQPSVSGQMGGEIANFINEAVELSVRWKMIDQASIRAIGEYWLRYGYAVRKFWTPPASMSVMSKFTYWKMKETYIVSAPMPETFKQVIRGIFEKGVTVWTQPGYIGTTDIGDNSPIGGFTL